MLLTTAGGTEVDLDNAAASAPGSLVVFLCNHCPYVKHVAARLGELSDEWSRAGLVVIGINPNAATHPGDAPERMTTFATSSGWGFPYLVDADQSVTRRFGAHSTPEPFLFDAGSRLFYHGQFDDTRPGRGDSNGSDLAAAVRHMLDDLPFRQDHRPAVGCAIKWLDEMDPRPEL